MVFILYGQLCVQFIWDEMLTEVNYVYWYTVAKHSGVFVVYVILCATLYAHQLVLLVNSMKYVCVVQ